MAVTKAKFARTIGGGLSAKNVAAPKSVSIPDPSTDVGTAKAPEFASMIACAKNVEIVEARVFANTIFSDILVRFAIPADIAARPTLPAIEAPKYTFRTLLCFSAMPSESLFFLIGAADYRTVIRGNWQLPMLNTI